MAARGEWFYLQRWRWNREKNLVKNQQKEDKNKQEGSKNG